MTALPYVDGAAIVAALPPAAAVEAILAGLRAGVDPAADTARSLIPTPSGDLLLMPSQSPTSVGVKLATVAPDNPSRDLPRISAVYVLFDGDTLAPSRLLDGVALTNLRTPAVSVAAVTPWLDRVEHPLQVVVFGAGPQGLGHLDVLADCYPIGSAVVVVRQPSRVDVGRRVSGRQVDGPSTGSGNNDEARLDGPSTGSGPNDEARVDGPSTSSGNNDAEVRVLAAGDAEVAERLREADVVVCATTAREPLFDSALLSDRAIVIAVGSHEPAAREVDAAFCGRATVVVEDPATALREGGDVIQAISEGTLDADRLVAMRALARGEVDAPPGPVFFKGSGMSWQDLVVAEAVLARC